MLESKHFDRQLPPSLIRAKSTLSLAPRSQLNSGCSKATWFRFQKELVLVSAESELCNAMREMKVCAREEAVLSRRKETFAMVIC